MKWWLLKIREMTLLRDFHSQAQTWACCFILWVYQPTSPFCSHKANLPRRLLQMTCY